MTWAAFLDEITGVSTPLDAMLEQAAQCQQALDQTERPAVPAACGEPLSTRAGTLAATVEKAQNLPARATASGLDPTRVPKAVEKALEDLTIKLVALDEAMDLLNQELCTRRLAVTDTPDETLRAACAAWLPPAEEADAEADDLPVYTPDDLPPPPLADETAPPSPLPPARPLEAIVSDPAGPGGFDPAPPPGGLGPEESWPKLDSGPSWLR